MNLSELAAPPPPMPDAVVKAIALERLKAFARALSGRDIYDDELVELSRLAVEADVDINPVPASIPRP